MKFNYQFLFNLIFFSISFIQISKINSLNKLILNIKKVEHICDYKPNIRFFQPVSVLTINSCYCLFVQSIFFFQKKIFLFLNKSSI